MGARSPDLGAGNPDLGLDSTLAGSLSSLVSNFGESVADAFLSIDLGAWFLSIDLGGVGLGVTLGLALDNLEGVVRRGVGELAADVGREEVPEGRKLVVLRGIDGSSLW